MHRILLLLIFNNFGQFWHSQSAS